MFTVAICDDDKIVLSSIQKCIEEFATENNISISVDLYDSGKKLLESSLKYLSSWTLFYKQKTA